MTSIGAKLLKLILLQLPKLILLRLLLQLVYTYFDSNEPNNGPSSSTGNCDCVRLWYSRGNRWGDYGCLVTFPYMCEAYPLTTTTATTEAPVTTTKTSQTTTGTQLTTAEVLMTTTEAALRTTELLLTTTEAPLTTSDVPLTSAEARMTTTDMSLTREPPFGECKNIFMQFI